jgi:hypothetical protein
LLSLGIWTQQSRIRCESRRPQQSREKWLEELIMPPASGAALREGWQCLSWDTVRPRVPEHPRADRECHDHDTAEHHPGERRERAKHQQEAEAEFDARDDHGIDARKRDSRSLERLPHGVSPIRAQQFAASGKHEEQTDRRSGDQNSDPLH